MFNRPVERDAHTLSPTLQNTYAFCHEPVRQHMPSNALRQTEHMLKVKRYTLIHTHEQRIT